MSQVLQDVKDFFENIKQKPVAEPRTNCILSPKQFEYLNESYEEFRDELRRMGFTHIVVCKDLGVIVSEEKL